MRGKVALVTGMLLGAGMLVAVGLMPHDATGAACLAAILSSCSAVLLESDRRKRRGCASTAASR